jgi:hypothetical protein
MSSTKAASMQVKIELRNLIGNPTGIPGDVEYVAELFVDGAKAGTVACKDSGGDWPNVTATNLLLVQKARNWVRSEVGDTHGYALEAYIENLAKGELL